MLAVRTSTKVRRLLFAAFSAVSFVIALLVAFVITTDAESTRRPEINTFSSYCSDNSGNSLQVWLSLVSSGPAQDAPPRLASFRYENPCSGKWGVRYYFPPDCTSPADCKGAYVLILPPGTSGRLSELELSHVGLAQLPIAGSGGGTASTRPDLCAEGWHAAVYVFTARAALSRLPCGG